MALKAPKSGFRALSEFSTGQGLQYSLKTGRPFPRPIFTRGPFDAEWRARCTPLPLPPSPPSPPVARLRRAAHGPSLLGSTTCNRATLCANCIDWLRPLMFIVRGDAFSWARGSRSRLGIVLANHGARARQAAYYWVIGMAACGDKDMAQVGAVWKDNVQVATNT